LKDRAIARLFLTSVMMAVIGTLQYFFQLVPHDLVLVMVIVYFLVAAVLISWRIYADFRKGLFGPN
jgi:hypothetical protein